MGGLLSTALLSSSLASPGPALPFSYRKELNLLSNEKQPNAPEDLLFLFTSKKDKPEVTQWLKNIMAPGSGSRAKLEQKFRLCQIELDLEETGKEYKDSWLWAQELGLPGTPALYLSDMQGRPYARHLGGIKAPLTNETWIDHLVGLKENRIKRDALLEEAQKLSGRTQGEKLLQAFHLVPTESIPAAYPEEAAKLAELLPDAPEAKRIIEQTRSIAADRKQKELISLWGSPAAATLKGAQVTLKQIDEYLKKENPQGELLQFILLEYRFPLLVTKARKAFESKPKGVFSQESDQTLREALDDLGTINNINPLNIYGREALRLKGEINEERRKMR